MDEQQVYLTLSPDLEALLSTNDLPIDELLKKAGLKNLSLGEDPVERGSGRKDPATIIMASAAAIATATPILRELIRAVSGRMPTIRQRRLLQAAKVDGGLAVDEDGKPLLQWHEVETPVWSGDKLHVKGFGIEISFESK